MNIAALKSQIDHIVSDYDEAMELLKNHNREWKLASGIVKEGIELVVRERIAEAVRLASQP